MHTAISEETNKCKKVEIRFGSVDEIDRMCRTVDIFQLSLAKLYGESKSGSSVWIIFTDCLRHPLADK